MEKALPIGSKVLIFNRSVYPKKNEFIKGVIIDSTKSKDLSHYVNVPYEIIYTVKGENHVTYIGTYGCSFTGNNVFFMTKEDYIKYLKERISKNYKIIYDLNCENEKYTEIINSLEQSKPKERIKSI